MSVRRHDPVDLVPFLFVAGGITLYFFLLLQAAKAALYKAMRLLITAQTSRKLLTERDSYE